jgi:hypothetical protein
LNGLVFSPCSSEGHGDSPNLKVREAPNKLSIKDIVERYGDVWFNGVSRR